MRHPRSDQEDGAKAKRAVAEALGEYSFDLIWDDSLRLVTCTHGIAVTWEAATFYTSGQIKEAHDQQLAINEEIERNAQKRPANTNTLPGDVGPADIVW